MLKPRLIKRKEVQQRTTLSTASIYRLMAENKFPRQIKVTGTSVAWNEQEVDEWIEQRIAHSNKAA